MEFALYDFSFPVETCEKQKHSFTVLSHSFSDLNLQTCKRHKSYGTQALSVH